MEWTEVARAKCRSEIGRTVTVHAHPPIGAGGYRAVGGVVRCV